MEEGSLNNQGFKNINKLPPEELIEIYFASDVFCFPTIVESFGNVFLEAMATGLPIVTTDAPGARDIIKTILMVLYLELMIKIQFYRISIKYLTTK